MFGVGVLGLALLLLWIYVIFDVISTDESLCRNMPKFVWLLVVIFLPTIGSVAWLILGRPQNAGFTPGNTSYRAPRSARGPEDSPDFMSGLDQKARELKAWEDELKRRERELDKRDEEDGT